MMADITVPKFSFSLESSNFTIDKYCPLHSLKWWAYFIFEKMVARYPSLSSLLVVLSSKIGVLCKKLLVQFATQSYRCFTWKHYHTYVRIRSTLCILSILIDRLFKRYVWIKLCTLNTCRSLCINYTSIKLF